MRVVHFNETEWPLVVWQADKAGVTVSRFLRDHGWSRVVGEEGHAYTSSSEGPDSFMTGAERDALLGRRTRTLRRGDR